MILPKNERRDVTQAQKRKIWIYGPSFSGKTTMLDQAPDPLNLNTDGNIEFVTMPYIGIKDVVTTEGRLTKRKYAWDILKETITELEKKDNDFKTIIVDLLEDTREMCRVKMYNDLNIQHESDSGYGKGWDIIKTEYLTTIRRLFNLDYENIVVVSHEDVSKDITKKNGQNITRIAPNIQDAIANKVAGMVDIVARVIVEDDGTRTLNFKSNEVIFGGGRLKGINKTSIPLSWDALMEVYGSVKKKPATDDDFEMVNEMKELDEEIKQADEREAGKAVAPLNQEPDEKPKRERRKRKDPPDTIITDGGEPINATKEQLEAIEEEIAAEKESPVEPEKQTKTTEATEKPKRRRRRKEVE